MAGCCRRLLKLVRTTSLEEKHEDALWCEMCATVARLFGEREREEREIDGCVGAWKKG